MCASLESNEKLIITTLVADQLYSNLNSHCSPSFNCNSTSELPSVTSAVVTRSQSAKEANEPSTVSHSQDRVDGDAVDADDTEHDQTISPVIDVDDVNYLAQSFNSINNSSFINEQQSDVSLATAFKQATT